MKKIFMILGAFVAALTACSYIVWQSEELTVSKYRFRSEKLPKAFGGFKIVHISDLHNKRFGKNNSKLLSLIAEQSPDIIVVSGDLLDSRHTDMDAAVEFAEGAAMICPVYYVTGNHEKRFSPEELSGFLRRLEEAGAFVLEDSALPIEKNGETIYICGLSDEKRIYDGMIEKRLFDIIPKDPGVFSVLISHRPQYAPEYAAAGADITFSGHAHGGQVRIPGLGGVLAPDQGFFPEYTEGMHRFDGRATVISRGLGNSLIPFRINNPPEIVTVTLECGNDR